MADPRLAALHDALNESPHAQSVAQLRQVLGRSPRVQGAVIQRALSAAEVQALIVRTGQMSVRLDQIIARLPDVIGNRVSTDEFMDPIRNVTNSARHNAGAVDAVPLNATLDTADAGIDTLDQLVTQHQPDFDAVRRVVDAVPVADRAAKFGQLNDAFAKLGQRISMRTAVQADVNVVRSAVERAIIPGNKEIQALRRQNAQTAMDRVALLVEAGLAEVGTLIACYASEFDNAADHFGGAWKLTPAAGSGKLQWLRDWEFHVHATVQRAAVPPNAVTGFTIHRAHIKPSSGARELGVSIQITNAALLAQVQNDNQAKIARWSQTGPGEAVLRKIKR